MRYGWFEQNLRFDERIAAWEPGRRIAWDITAGDHSAVPAPWREIGGRAFDVTGASYWRCLPELQRPDVFALPMRTRLAGLNPEGLGLAALEAAACGLPVVVGRSGGAPETVQPGRTGSSPTVRRCCTR